MPRSSRHKSHKQSKHREQSDSDEDVKIKDMNGRDDFSVRISGSSEKRKTSSGKDATGHGNGDTTEEYSGSKRKREKTVSGVATDRWNGGGVEGQNSITMEKESKGGNSRDADKSSRSKSSSDLRSKSSRKHESSNEKREDVIVPEKEESRTASKVDLKRNSEKDQGRKEAQQHKEGKESKDRDRGSERKVDSKRDADTRGVVSEVSMKMDLNEERQAKRNKENTYSAVQDEFRNLELEKELEKRMKRRTDSSREKHQADVKESESRKHSSKTDSAKNGRHKDEKHKDGSYGDKHLEDGDRESRYREEKFYEDSERDRRNKDVKHREDGEREQRCKDSKYHDDVNRDIRHRNDRHRDGGHRDSRYEENIREDGDRVKRKREDKFLEDDNVENSRYNDKHHETSNGESKDKVDKIRDGRERDDRRRDDKYRDDGSRDGKQKEEKHRDDTDKDNRHKDGKQRDDSDRAKRLRDIKYRDEHLRDGSNDKHDAKRGKIESAAVERHKKSSNQDVHDHNSRDKDEKERRRETDKDYNDSRSLNAKDQTSEVDKKYVGSARIETVSDQGKSSSRNADLEISPSRSRRRNSPNSVASAKSHSRIMQEDVHEERSRNRLSSKKEFGGAGGGGAENASSISRSIERSVQKDDLHYREMSVEKRPKLDARTSPLQLADKSPSSTSVERRHFSRSDVRRSYDIDESGQRSGGGLKDYPGKEGGRGSRDLAMETFPGNDDTFSASSPFTRSNHISSDSRSLLPPPLFRTGSDSHSIIGSMEDDSRGKSNNHRNRRVVDSSIGRAQGNTWKVIQNWPSPVANGFMPFQHGPTSVGFHPVMQHFHAPPIFGVPPMELNHSGVPYHLHDGDGFSVHGRPIGWRNPMDDSTALMWDGNNAAVYRDESQMFGRLGWDQNRAIGGMSPWETRQDSWKGQQSGSNAEMASLPHRGDGIINGISDDVSIVQSALQSESDLNLQNIKADGDGVFQSNAVVENEIIMAPKTISEEIQNQSDVSKKDDASRRNIYLSKIGVSVDVIAPDFYDSCLNLKDIEDEPNSGKDDSVILFLEGAIQNRKGKYGNSSKSFPQPTTNEAIFQKALSLYHKQTEGWRTFTYKEAEEEEEEEVLQSNDNVKDLSDMARHEEEKSLPMLDKGIVESSPPILHQIVLPDDVMLNAEVPDDVMLDAEEVVAVLDKTVDIDNVLPLKKFMEDKEEEVVENGEDASNLDQQGEEDTTKPPGDDDPNQFAEEQCPPNQEKRGGGNGEEGGGSLILSDIVPPLSEDDVVMPDSDNLTRIHQCSSESTH